MIVISDNLKAQKAQLMRLVRNMTLGLTIFFTVDRGMDAIMLYGLDRYFGLDTDNALLLVGHSHVVLGLDRIALEQELNVSVSKYARAGAQLDDRILMVRHYAERHPDGLRAVVFGVDGHLFSPEGLSSNAHRLFYPHMREPLIDAYLSVNANTWLEYMIRRVVHLARYNDVLLNAARRGLTNDWSSGIESRFDPDRLAREAALGEVREIGIDPAQVAKFEAFLVETDSKGWPVILTFVPTSEAWNTLEPEKFDYVLSLLQGYANRLDNVRFLDMRDPWSEQVEIFADPIHLNVKGQKLVSADLARRLGPILQEHTEEEK